MIHRIICSFYILHMVKVIYYYYSN